MELKLTSDEISDLLKDQHKENIKDTIERMIEFYRRIEKEFQEGKGESSGLDMLNLLLQEGSMNFNMFLKIRHAVLYYNSPYEVIID